jgi:hypothetical protein
MGKLLTLFLDRDISNNNLAVFLKIFILNQNEYISLATVKHFKYKKNIKEKR